MYKKINEIDVDAIDLCEIINGADDSDLLSKTVIINDVSEWVTRCAIGWKMAEMPEVEIQIRDKKTHIDGIMTGEEFDKINYIFKPDKNYIFKPKDFSKGLKIFYIFKVNVELTKWGHNPAMYKPFEIIISEVKKRLESITDRTVYTSLSLDRNLLKRTVYFGFDLDLI